jgi:hypothetical protein
MFNLLTFKKVWIVKLIVFLFTLMMTMGWNNLIFDKSILNKSSVLPATFVLLISLFFSYSPIWPVNFLLLFYFNNLFSIYQIDRPYVYLFDAGLILGICFLFYPPTILFLLTLFAANFIYSSLGWRSFVIPIFGFLAPFFLTLGYLYCFSSISNFVNHYFQAISFYTPSIQAPNYLSFFIITSLVIFIFSVIELIRWLHMKSLRSRKSFIILFIFSFCVFLGLFFKSSLGWDHLFLFVLPFSVLSSNYFLFVYKKWWYESLFIILLISVFYFFIRSFLTF